MFTILGADGKEYGPVDAATINQWIASGRADARTKIRRDGTTAWQTIADCPEFAVTLPPPATAVTPPPVPPAAPAEANLPSPWLRLGAVLLDTVIALFCLAPGFLVLVLTGALQDTAGAVNTGMLALGGGLCLLGFLILVIVQLYLLVTRGQTIGKKIVGIKIVDFETGLNPGFVKTVLLRSFVNSLISGVPLLGGAYSLVDALFIFREDHRCIHDLLAGTKVVTA